MNISKDTASAIAQKLTAKKQENFTKLQKDLKEFLDGECLGEVPPAVLLDWQDPKLKSYIKNSVSVRITGEGFVSNYHCLSEALPSANASTFCLVLTGAKLNKYSKFIKQIEVSCAELDKLRTDITNALCTLKSAKRITEQFPEAAEFLPETQTYPVPAIDLSKIRKSLKS